MRIGVAFAVLLLLALAPGAASAADIVEPAAAPLDPQNTLYLDLTHGRVVIRLRPDLAPNHVARVKHLVRGAFFDGLPFHRVINGFVAQTGDPTGTGVGGTGRLLKAEFARTPHRRGIVSMARAANRNSADSQFFIVTTDNRAKLDGKYTVWGEVVSGMEFVDMIRKGTGDSGAVTDPDHILTLRLAADVDMPRGAMPDLKHADTLAVVREFSGGEFKCRALSEGLVPQARIAPLWAHGYLAGYYKGRNTLTLVEGEAGFGKMLADACASYPNAYLPSISAGEIAKAPQPLPNTTPAFSLASYTCKDYGAARKGADTATADIIDLWSIAFIEGYKAVGQPEFAVPYDARKQILTALGAACAKTPDMTFFDLTSAVAEKVKLKR
jgi:peptidylprolyl isomerase